MSSLWNRHFAWLIFCGCMLTPAVYAADDEVEGAPPPRRLHSVEDLVPADQEKLLQGLIKLEQQRWFAEAVQGAEKILRAWVGEALTQSPPSPNAMEDGAAQGPLTFLQNAGPAWVKTLYEMRNTQGARFFPNTEDPKAGGDGKAAPLSITVKDLYTFNFTQVDPETAAAQAVASWIRNDPPPHDTHAVLTAIVSDLLGDHTDTVQHAYTKALVTAFDLIVTAEWGGKFYDMQRQGQEQDDAD